MKKVLIVLAIAGCALALTDEDVLDAEWKNFKEEQHKSFQDESEEQLRRQIFKDNKIIIDKHNARYAAGEETWEMGVNQFTDMLPEEFEQKMLGYFNETDDPTEKYLTYQPPANFKIPSSIDWRQYGAVTRVKNQGSCKSSWAFATTGTLEGQHFRKTGKLVELSEQNLLDCSSKPPYLNIGCRGGTAPRAMVYVIKNKGINTAKSYPYKAAERRCRFNKQTVGARMKNYVRIPEGNERALAVAVAERGPIAAAIDASNFRMYKSGVINKPCSHSISHEVLVVGYGHDKRGGDYWLIKNSWGTRVGEKGYYRMARNRNNLCFIATIATYPIV